MILGLKYQLILTNYKDLKYFPKNKQNEEDVAEVQNITKLLFQNPKPFPLSVLGFSYSKLLKIKCYNKGCLRYLKI